MGTRRDQRGVALSSPLALLSVGAVVIAGAAFVLTNGPEHKDAVPAAASSTVVPSSTPTPTPAAPTVEKRVRKPPVKRADTFVTVFNNSGVSGLAGSTAARAAGAGWQVVGSDNWYGTIDASTVYFPPRLREHAELLAKELGISRVKPSIAPMQGDRLTVILTRDYT